jgi:hypothetical protein
MGDYNLPLVDWSLYHAPDNVVYNGYMSFFNNYGLYQHVNIPTRDNNILDLVLTASVSDLCELEVLPPIGNSDHCVILFSTNAYIHNITDEPVQLKPNWARANFAAISSALSLVDWNNLFQYCFSIHDCWDVFTQIIDNICSQFVPLIHIKPPTSKKSLSKRRYPRFIQDLMKIKLVAWRRWKITSHDDDKYQYTIAQHNCSKAINRFHEAKEMEMLRKNNLKSFYNFVNKKTSNRSVIGDIRCPDGSMTSDVRKKCDIFNEFFASVFTIDNGSSPPMASRQSSDRLKLTSILFTPDLVFSALRNLKPSTTVGSDNIPNMLLKNSASALCVPLCHIFDVSFKDGVLPDSWKLATIVPIHKKGPTIDPNNFRPISLTSTCCRVMERIICNEIQRHLSAHKLISNNQHGFVKNRSTATNLLECSYDWSYSIELGHHVDVIYFDFKKAFDSVSHPKLLTKIKAYGIDGKLYEWVSAFLKGRSQSVKIDNIFSSIVTVTSGVPQGSVLGPILFLMFINDICDLFNDLNVKSKLFADDLKLYANRTDGDAVNDLTTALERLESWCNDWQLYLASDKCSVLQLGPRSSRVPQAKYKLCSNALSVCKSIRDLGIVVDSGLNFAEHVSIITRKALLRCKLILKCFCSRNRDLLVKAYVTYVRPLLEYASSVWSPHHLYLISKLEKVQRYFTKRLPGMWHLPYEQRLTSLNLRSLQNRRMLGDLSLCYQIVKHNIDTSLSHSLIVIANSRTRGHDMKLRVNSFSRDITKSFFTNRVIKAWNRLPFTKCASTNTAFKRQLAALDCNFFNSI